MLWLVQDTTKMKRHPNDAVDEDQVAQPRPWNIDEIRRFILCVGPISSIFDYTTFFVMLWVFNCWDPARAHVFQTGWFVKSLMMGNPGQDERDSGMIPNGVPG